MLRVKNKNSHQSVTSQSGNLNGPPVIVHVKLRHVADHCIWPGASWIKTCAKHGRIDSYQCIPADGGRDFCHELAGANALALQQGQTLVGTGAVGVSGHCGSPFQSVDSPRHFRLDGTAGMAGFIAALAFDGHHLCVWRLYRNVSIRSRAFPKDFIS